MYMEIVTSLFLKVFPFNLSDSILQCLLKKTTINPKKLLGCIKNVFF